MEVYYELQRNEKLTKINGNENHEDFTKALISFEKGINYKGTLDKLYQEYMDNDSMSLLSNEFDYLMDEP